MENQINNTSVEEVQEQTETTEVKAKEEVKTFTQEEVDKIIAKRIAREKKDIEAKIEAERKQAEELAKLSEQDKAKKLLEIKEKELEEKIKAFENEKLLNETSKQLASKNLPTEFAEILKGVDAETTFENIKVFEEKFNAALEVKVNERLRGNVPKAGATGGGVVNPYDKKTFSLTKQMELEMNNPTLAEQLRKLAK